MERKKITERLIFAGTLSPFATLVGCIAVMAGVISDSTAWQVIGAFLIIAAFAANILGMLLSLLTRQRKKTFYGVLSLVSTLVIGFLTAILIGVGQHHPPGMPEAAIDDTFMFTTPTSTSDILGTDIEAGSWWTDGHHYYQVKKTGNSYQMEGMTLHEGGLEACIDIVGDSLFTGTPPCGFNSFAESGHLVRHHIVLTPDSTNIELLVAYNKENRQEPVAVLQRFDGDELRYELDGIHALLEGIYSDGKDTWTFLADGTMRMASDAEAKPYEVELFYHIPTNVVRLPDGRHVALQLATDELKVLEATYDEDEEEWRAVYPEKVLMKLERDGNVSPDQLLMEEGRLLTPAMVQYMDGDYEQIRNRYYDMRDTNHLIGRLNDCLLNRWISEQSQEQEEEQ